jgi:hypothetical protein
VNKILRPSIASPPPESQVSKSIRDKLTHNQKPKKRTTVSKAILTANKKKAFLKAYYAAKSVKKACDITGVSRYFVNRWQEEDKGFAKMFNSIATIVIDELEETAIERANSGSDQLLMFLLKGNRPDKYGNKLQIGAGAPPTESPNEWIALAHKAARSEKDGQDS